MAMGKRPRDRQPAMWVPTTQLPTSASHPFYARLNQLLRDRAFDDFAETQCRSFYAETMGRPGVGAWDLFPIVVGRVLRGPRLRAGHRVARGGLPDVAGLSRADANVAAT
jgi:hypothetical protein